MINVIASLKVHRQVDSCGDFYETVCDLLVDGVVVATRLGILDAEKRALELNQIYVTCITQMDVEMNLEMPPVGDNYKRVVYMLGKARVI